MTGRMYEAIESYQKAVMLDPLQIRNNCSFGWTYYMAREYDKAIDQANHTLELPGAPLWDHIWIAMSYNLQGKYDKALRTLENIKSKAENWLSWMAESIYSYHHSGRKAEERKLIDKKENLGTDRNRDPYFMTIAYAGVHDVDKTIEWIEKSIDQRTFRILSLAVEPKFDFIRNDPRYRKLLQRIQIQPEN